MHTTIPQSYADNLQFVYLKVCVVWTNRQQLKNCHQIDPFRMDDNRGAFQVLRSNKCATFFNYDWCMPSNYLFCLRNHNSAFSALRFCMKFHYNEAFSSSLVFYHFWPKIVLSTGIKITPILTAYLKQRNHNIAHIITIDIICPIRFISDFELMLPCCWLLFALAIVAHCRWIDYVCFI